MASWISFDQALQLSPNAPKNLLIGNGFSIAAATDFAYPSLFSVTNFSGIECIQQIFNNFSTFDFEQILQYLDISSVVAKSMNIHALSYQLQYLRTELISRFVQSIIRIHPTNIFCEQGKITISKPMIQNTNIFLKNFTQSGSIFTLNYDLILYWSILEGITSGTFNVADGFSNNQNPLNKNYWENRFRTTLFFLHGALHLRTDNYGDSYKIKYLGSDSLLTQTTNDLLSSIYPLIVFEGTSNDKMKKIKNNRYLSMCYDSLSSVGGDLFTYGVAFSQNDSHISRAIATNHSINSIFIGIYCDNNTLLQQLEPDIYAAINFFEQNYKQVYIYSTKQIQLW